MGDHYPSPSAVDGVDHRDRPTAEHRDHRNLPGGMANDRVWIRLTPGRDQPIVWKLAPVLASGAFTTTIGPVPAGAATVQVEAHFDGNDLLASSAVGPVTVPTAGAGGGLMASAPAAGDRCRGRHADRWGRRWRRCGRLDRSDDRWGRIMTAPGSLVGRVALAEGHPLAGFIVELRVGARTQSAVTDGNGEFRLEALQGDREPAAVMVRAPNNQVVLREWYPLDGRYLGITVAREALPGGAHRGMRPPPPPNGPALAEPVDVGDAGEVLLPGLPALAGAPEMSIAGAGDRIAVASGTTVWVWTIQRETRTVAGPLEVDVRSDVLDLAGDPAGDEIVLLLAGRDADAQRALAVWTWRVASSGACRSKGTGTASRCLPEARLRWSPKRCPRGRQSLAAISASTNWSRPPSTSHSLAS